MSGIDIDIERFIKTINNPEESQTNFFEDFDEPKYKPSDLEISARVINYWSKNDLLFKSENGWHRFNIHQAVWVKIVQQLRGLNLSIKAIKKIKTNLLQVPDYNKVFANEEPFDKLKKALDRKDMQEVASLMDKGDLQTELRKEQISILQLILFDLMGVRSNWRILFNAAGEIMFHKDNYDEELKNFTSYIDFMKTTHVSISLNSVLFEITNNLVEDEDLRKLHILNNKEYEILLTIREKNVKKIEVTFSAKNSPELIKVTRVNKLDTASRVKELLLTNGYQDIKITTQKGDVVHFENTTKKKL